MSAQRFCKSCGEFKTIKARGWCGACYSRWLAHGKPKCGPHAVSRLPKTPRHYSNIPAEWSDEQTRAARMVAGRASGHDECRLLLQVIGLLPSDGSADRIGGAA